MNPGGGGSSGFSLNSMIAGSNVLEEMNAGDNYTTPSKDKDRSQNASSARSTTTPTANPAAPGKNKCIVLINYCIFCVNANVVVVVLLAVVVVVVDANVVVIVVLLAAVVVDANVVVVVVLLAVCVVTPSPSTIPRPPSRPSSVPTPSTRDPLDMTVRGTDMNAVAHGSSTKPPSENSPSSHNMQPLVVPQPGIMIASKKVMEPVTPPTATTTAANAAAPSSGESNGLQDTNCELMPFNLILHSSDMQVCYKIRIV